jgi:type III secretion protein W
MSDPAMDAADRLIGSLLTLAEASWIAPAQVDKLVREQGLGSTEAEIYFLREVADMARALPLKIFKDPEQRLKLVDAVQDSLDKAIEREEAELAEGGG